VTVADLDLIENAAAELDGIAGEIALSSTRDAEHTDWTGEDDANAEFDRLRAMVSDLYELGGRVRQSLGMDPL